MENQLEQIRDQQKETWNKFAPGWGKWDTWVMNFLKKSGDEIIHQLQLKNNDVVLDVATGTGEPGLSIAGIVKNGKVIGQDLSDKMLALARAHAESRGIKNYETRNCDISELPFPDNSFDAVSCRMGYMFFPDMLKATQEIYRVPNTGGRFATAVWGPAEKNFWIISIMGPISKNLELPPPVPGAPGMFRCANPDQMKNIFETAGFKNVMTKEKIDQGEAESFESYWEYMNDVAAPVVSALSKADEKTRAKIKQDAYEGFKKRQPGSGPISLDYSVFIFSGSKQA
ncbi:MAG: methyltransferase domain-containing protein [Bacteroidetes bacterium]|nr:MAG: methyltransferase domain-containing protein [Bacteroidota bacterium]